MRSTYCIRLMITAFTALILFGPTCIPASADTARKQQANARLVGLWPRDSQAYYSSRVPIVELAQVKAALTRGADVNARNVDGRSALMLASEDGNLPCVKYLVSRGANVNAADPDGWTPLVFACFLSKVDCATYLISKGASVNRKVHGGQTPLAVEAQALMELSMAADANARHPVSVADGQTGIMQCVRLLIAKGADVNMADDDGDTPLMLAAQGDAIGNIECIRLLVSKGAHVNARNKDSKSALDLASGKENIVAVLKSLGAK